MEQSTSENIPSLNVLSANPPTTNPLIFLFLIGPVAFIILLFLLITGNFKINNIFTRILLILIGISILYFLLFAWGWSQQGR